MLRGLARTFELVPLTDGAADHLARRAAPSRRSRTIFASALEVAAPVLLALLITDVAFGVVSRVVPQLNVFAVGFPVKVGVGAARRRAPRCRSSAAGSPTSSTRQRRQPPSARCIVA